MIVTSHIDPAAYPTKKQLHDAFEWLRSISITESDPNADTAAMLMYEIAALKTQCDELVKNLVNAEYFIRGFEDDEMQEGVDDLLAGVRGAILLVNGVMK